ncbi:MAG: 2-C-methyl-D-erythritol 4-phosphate cytidylyltransferase [Eubacteriales bacterium]|nr:2-C-methyl-D-erythritol 4-phosphate cytidylyltransferase [Eubacteriales bacterium]
MGKDNGDRPYAGAVIVAAGRGQRLGAGIKKQFIRIRGLSSVARCTRAFGLCADINEVVIVVDGSDIDYCKEDLTGAFGGIPPKVKAIVAGGPERQDSVFEGLKNIFIDADIVLIHDGVRPFVQGGLISAVVRDASEAGASCAAVPAHETVKMTDGGSFVCATPDRSKLWYAQTPQAFRRDIIFRAYEKALNDGYRGTDDSCLAERLGYKVKITMGDRRNIKITTAEDLIMAGVIADEIADSEAEREYKF